MNELKFYEELSSILEVDKNTISEKSKLKTFKAWDSLGMMTFVVIFKKFTKKEINPIHVARCQTVKDLKKILI